MERSAGTFALIKALGYKGGECLRACNCDELPCALVSWLLTELRAKCPDLPAQSIECGGVSGDLRQALRDMTCPHDQLMSRPFSLPLPRTLTEYLLSELMAAHILIHKESHPNDADQTQAGGKEQRQQSCLDEDEHQEIAETEESKTDPADVNADLSGLFQTLGLEAFSQLSDACAEVESRLKLLPKGEGFAESLLKVNLNSDQWRKVSEINSALCKDYQCRRQMMIKRFCVTVQSFTWGEKGKERISAISSIERFSASPEPSVTIPTLLASREDQSRVTPVKAGSSSAVHKVLMGSVPDRGGRPGEIEPPMPSFISRRDGAGHPYRKRRREFSGKKKKKT